MARTQLPYHRTPGRAPVNAVRPEGGLRLALRQAAAVWIPLLVTALAGCSGPSDGPPVIDPDEAKVGRYGAWQPIPSGVTPPNLLLITIDTTRRDHLSCYRVDRKGAATPITPHLDRLASDGIVFEHAVSPVPVTAPSHATILTGFLPYQHGVRNNGTYILPDRHLTLAEALKARGYATGAILGAFPVAAQFNLDQGFDLYDDQFPLSSALRESDTAQRRADEVTRLGLDWMRRESGSPFFLWLHYFDPHFPYEPPAPWSERFPGDPYAGEVAYMDAQIGVLLEEMAKDGRLESTAIIVAADHGESLGEHRERTHSLFIYGATQDVPLILRLPSRDGWNDKMWRGRRVDALVQLADCFPTLLNLAGVPEQDRPLSAGMSLLPVIAGTSPGHAWTYLETLVPRLEYGLSDLRGLRTPRWKYIRAPREELYDLKRDPGELENLAEKKPRVVAEFRAALETLLRMDSGAEAQVSMDRETVEKLRSLGYVAAGEMPERTGPAIDPKDMIQILDRIDYARALIAGGRNATALALVDSVLGAHPTDPTARRMRGSLLIRLGRGREAIELYDRIIAECGGRCPDEFELQRNRAIAALAAGDLDDAFSRARALAESEPDQPGVFLLLGQVLERRGDLGAARRALEEQTRRTPRETPPWVGLAELELTAGNPSAAEQAYRRALDLNPLAADALVGLGELLLATGRGTVARGYFDQAMAADPANAQALFRKAWYLRQEGRSDEARRYYQLALEQNPTHQAALFNLGNLMLESGELDPALRLFDAALRAGAESPALLLNLGTAHARLGNTAAARAAWERALTLGANGAEAAILRRNLEELGRR